MTLGMKTQLGLGLGIPIGSIAVLLLGIYIWRKKLGKKHKDSAQAIYSGYNGETEAHGHRHELPGEDRKADADTDGERVGIPSVERERGLPMRGARQELSGKDHAQELEMSTAVAYHY